MLSAILYGIIGYSVITISEIVVSSNLNHARIQGKMEERIIYEGNPSPIKPTNIQQTVKDKYDVEEI